MITALQSWAELQRVVMERFDARLSKNRCLRFLESAEILKEWVVKHVGLPDDVVLWKIRETVLPWCDQSKPGIARPVPPVNRRIIPLDDDNRVVIAPLQGKASQRYESRMGLDFVIRRREDRIALLDVNEVMV